MVWCVSGGGCCGILTLFLNSAREVIDASLLQEYVPSMSPPPEGLTTAKTPSMSYVFFYLFSLQHLSIIKDYADFDSRTWRLTNSGKL